MNTPSPKRSLVLVTTTLLAQLVIIIALVGKLLLPSWGEAKPHEETKRSYLETIVSHGGSITLLQRSDKTTEVRAQNISTETLELILQDLPRGDEKLIAIRYNAESHEVVIITAHNDTSK